MPDPWRFLAAMGLAAGLAALAVALGGRRGRARRAAEAGVSRSSRAFWIVGIGAAWWLGCRWLGLRIHWPPSEDLDRLFLVLWPATLGVELVVCVLPDRWKPAWLMRLAVSAAAAPTLLFGSIYVCDLAGPGSRRWTTWQTLAIFGLLAIALAGVWASLAKLAGQSAGRSVVLAAAMCSAAAGIAIMLSGSMTAGQIGLPLAAALAGASATSLVIGGPQGDSAAIGPAVVGLFALIVVGRFFADLTTLHAVLLFTATLGCWVSALPYIRNLRPAMIGTCRLAAVAVPLAIVVIQAQSRFAANAASAGEYGAYGAAAPGH
ncbi:MAG TPA: hypothetical protein VGX78_06710 [Pirellulales bacterium]|jgi:hypothetical protein|nr:hypothetical protein [Pirellulales bacterium]